MTENRRQPLSPEAQAARKPLSPEVLSGALQDTVHHLTLAELRELEASCLPRSVDNVNWNTTLRAVRELIALRERLQKYGDPSDPTRYEAITDRCELLKASHDRLRKAAEEFMKRGNAYDVDAEEQLRLYDALEAALAEDRTDQA